MHRGSYFENGIDLWVCPVGPVPGNGKTTRASALKAESVLSAYTTCL